ncbi:MAG: RNA polymerase sporulation sigma factor SigK [Eubacteriales bacterium]|nr:RNA polymerase sporulation sigma factor SigK [Eubacteriales bacterium]MDD4079419.1 RNA polymerase sporulation sigma factor SigK [Eubacteriales bacterium]MDD4769351.1 RNA polymerase sporulation sigma factor SigK [Eubacteriales bacterium]
MIIGLLIAMAMAVKELALLVSHIKNNSFPHPLGPEEERECLLRSARGDEEARRILIEHNLRLVAHIVKKYDNTRLENDDLISIGTVGLIKAINTYDLEKGVKLATYAARCIENEILMQLRSMKKNRDDISLQEPLGVDQEGNELSLMDILGNQSDLFEKVHHKIEVARLLKMMKSLPQRERFVLERRFALVDGRSWPQREIAAELGISRSYVSRIEKRALRMLTSNLLRS